VLGAAALVAAAPAIAGATRAFAQSYPSRPIRWIVSFAAGGANDIVARLLGQFLSDKLGQQFLVEVRPGAAGNIATEAVTHMPPDGYTLLLINSQNAINVALYEKLGFDFVRDILPVAGMSQFAAALVALPSFPARTVPDLLAAVKNNPGKITIASAGVGSISHMSWELFKSKTGADMLHVPYRGEGPAIADLLGGQVQVMMPSLPPSIEHIRAGKLRPLAVTAASHVDALPGVPTIGEFVPGYENTAWVGITAPRNTPADIVATLNREINAALDDPKIKARLAELGMAPFASSSADFGRFVVRYTENWAKVIKAANIKAE